MPRGYKGKPQNIFGAVIMGANLGWLLMRSLHAIHKETIRDADSGRATERSVEQPMTMAVPP